MAEPKVIEPMGSVNCLLTNPEKSLVATIRPSGPGEAERSFRYAPLSSGLEIASPTVKFVAKQACLICGRRPADPHHLRFAQHRALGRKVSDEFTVYCGPVLRHAAYRKRADE
jgi:hypothetical protein